MTRLAVSPAGTARRARLGLRAAPARETGLRAVLVLVPWHVGRLGMARLDSRAIMSGLIGPGRVGPGPCRVGPEPCRAGRPEWPTIGKLGWRAHPPQVLHRPGAGQVRGVGSRPRRAGQGRGAGDGKARAVRGASSSGWCGAGTDGARCRLGRR